MAELLVYETLVNDYYQNLHTTLRNFRPGPEYLESWVHDEDHTRSILGIFEAAESGDLEALSLQLDPKTFASVNLARLTSELKSFGTLTVTEEPSHIILRLAYGAQPTATSSVAKVAAVHPAYEKALVAATKNLRHQGEITKAASGQHTVTATLGKIQLSVLVNERTVVSDAKHKGAAGLEKGLMDALCSTLINRPLQEGAEHAAIRLESQLRDKTQKPPVAGLVTPENADPIFKIATTIVRDCFARYLKETKQEPQWNDWEEPFTLDWLALSNEGRLEKIRDFFKTAAESLQVLSIKNHSRVILAYDKRFNESDFGHRLMVLEKQLQTQIEPRLEIVLESLEDKNQREERSRRDLAFGKETSLAQ